MIDNVEFRHKVHKPPKFSLKDSASAKHTLKRPGEKITIDGIRKGLALISWTLSHRGCDHYAVVNQKGEMTNFWIRRYSDDDVHVEFIRNEKVFGETETGFLSLHLKECEVEINGGDCLFVSAPSSKPGGISATFFLSNRDKKYRPSEAYIASLPRAYQEVMVCDRCKAVLNKTYRLPGIYFLIDTLRGLAAPLNSPRCPKCKYSSCSDINFAFDTFIRRIKTKARVTERGLRRVYAKELARYEELKSAEREEDRKRQREKELATAGAK